MPSWQLVFECESLIQSESSITSHTVEDVSVGFQCSGSHSSSVSTTSSSMPETFRVNAQKRVAVQYGQKRDKSKQMPLPSMQALDAHSHSQVFRSRPAPIQRILGCLMAQCVLACTNRAGASIAASNNIKFILIQGITGSYCHILSSLPTVMEHLPSSSSKASWHHALLLEQRVDTHTHTYNLHPAIHWHHYNAIQLTALWYAYYISLVMRRSLPTCLWRKDEEKETCINALFYSEPAA